MGKAAAKFYQMKQESATGALCQGNRFENGVGILDFCVAWLLYSQWFEVQSQSKGDRYHPTSG